MRLKKTERVEVGQYCVFDISYWIEDKILDRLIIYKYAGSIMMYSVR